MSVPQSALLTALSATLLLAAYPIEAAGGSADVKVKAQLDQKKTPYKIDDAVDFAATAADEMESELTGKDDL